MKQNTKENDEIYKDENEPIQGAATRIWLFFVVLATLGLLFFLLQ